MLFFENAPDPVAIQRIYGSSNVVPQLTGAVDISDLRVSRQIKFNSMFPFIKSNDSLERFQLFKSSVMDTHSSLVLSLLTQNETFRKGGVKMEQDCLAKYYLDLLLRTSGIQLEWNDLQKMEAWEADFPSLAGHQIGNIGSSRDSLFGTAYYEYRKYAQAVTEGKGCIEGDVHIDGGQEGENSEDPNSKQSNIPPKEIPKTGGSIYQDYVRDHHSFLVSWDKKQMAEFYEHWQFKGRADRRATEMRALKRSPCIPEEALLAHQKKQIMKELCDKTCRAEVCARVEGYGGGWIEAVLSDVRARAAGRKPPRAIPALTGVLMAGAAFFTAGYSSLARNR